MLLSPHEWAARYRRDDGEQQPISPVEREFGTESHGRRYGLDLIGELLDGLGRPQLRYPTIHVGGSKGKGSTVAVLTAILRAAGLRVGTYTSPSLTHFGERIVVAGQPITDVEAEQHISAMRPVLRRLPDQPRFFEAATAVAFQHFAQCAVDVAVIEVGLGGRLDATNLVAPEVAVITSIELEHTHILGDTLAAIAAEKAGIIKLGVPTVTGVSEPEPLDAIAEVCRKQRSQLWRLGEHFTVTSREDAPTWQSLDLELLGDLGPQRLGDVRLGLPGTAQGGNAAVAVAAARAASQRFSAIDERAIRRGLADARWPGRLELVDRTPCVLLDVAHTPASARQLRHYLDRFFGGTPKTLVIGLLRDKKAAEIAGEIADAFDHVIVAPIKWFRSMEPDQLREAFLALRDEVEVAPSICSGVNMALRRTPADGLVVVAGSLFGVGETKRGFGW
jgi:dihydrofolate synthase/folylpolyglutamate synthase